VDEKGTGHASGILTTWREAPRSVKAMLLGVFVNKLAGFIQIFLVLFLTHRGFSGAQAGLALGVYAGGAVFGTFLGGALTDRLSARGATLISMTGSAVLILSILYLHMFPLLLAAVLLVSTIGQLYRPAAQTLITELTHDGRLVMVTAMYRLALNLGTTATPLIGAALVSISYNLLFWGESLAALTYALIALIALPGGSKEPAPDPEPVADTLPTASVAPAASRPTRGYLAILADWRYTVFLLAVLLMSTVYCQYTATLSLAITDGGLSMWWYSAVVSLNGFIIITCELLMTKLVQSWPLRLTTLAGFGLVAIGYGVYAIGMHPAVLVVGTLIWTLSEIIGAPTVFAYPAMAAPEHLRGRYIGAMQSFFSLGAAIGPVIGITLWNRIGQSVWLWVAVVSVAATVLGQIGIRTAAPRSETAAGPAAAEAPVAP
jgi:predicted MFS family arabinose efflux permease